MKKNIGIGLLVLVVLAAFGVGYALSAKRKASPANEPSISTPSASAGDTSVDVSGQQLTTLPASITDQTEITSLNASNNQLTTLPASIGKMANLTVLNVENNRLVSLPAEIGSLAKLKSADFSNNRLESLPPELGNLTGLETLNLDGYKGPRSDIDQLKLKLPHTTIKY